MKNQKKEEKMMAKSIIEKDGLYIDQLRDEIFRLNNIINELEKDMRETIEILKTTEYQKIDIDYVIETLDIYCDRLKSELKEGK